MASTVSSSGVVPVSMSVWRVRSSSEIRSRRARRTMSTARIRSGVMSKAESTVPARTASRSCAHWPAAWRMAPPMAAMSVSVES